MWFPSQTLFNDFMQILHMLVEVKSMEKKKLKTVGLPSESGIPSTAHF